MHLMIENLALHTHTQSGSSYLIDFCQLQASDMFLGAKWL
jgi:hypothetical protein